MTLNKINSLLFIGIPFFRLILIFIVFSGSSYKDYVLIYSLAQFIPELLTLFYDNSLKIKKESIQRITSIIGLFFIFIWLISLIMADSSQLNQNFLYFLIVFTLHDHILLSCTPTNSDKTNSLFNINRVFSLIFIYLSVPFLLIIPLIISHYLFTSKVNKYKHNDISVSISDLKYGLLLVTFSRFREYFTLRIIQGFLSNDLFFIVNIFSRILIWVLNMFYTILRNMREKNDLIGEYYNKIKTSLNFAVYCFIILLVIPVFMNVEIYYYYLLGFIFYLYLGLELFFNQFTVLFRKGRIKLLAFNNLLALLILMIPSLYLSNITFFMVILAIAATLVNSSILFYSWKKEVK
ncbi:MAG: hypothetical protein VX890_05075 [Pseudomonadota bacterium]|nr:hypothetical protein [Pseudomonadota bacterium]